MRTLVGVLVIIVLFVGTLALMVYDPLNLDKSGESIWLALYCIVPAFLFYVTYKKLN